MTKINLERMKELQAKQYLTPEEARELGHMRLAQLINVEAAC